jgi:hypothetical protein
MRVEQGEIMARGKPEYRVIPFRFVLLHALASAKRLWCKKLASNVWYNQGSGYIHLLLKYGECTCFCEIK